MIVKSIVDLELTFVEVEIAASAVKGRAVSFSASADSPRLKFAGNNSKFAEIRSRLAKSCTNFLFRRA